MTNPNMVKPPKDARDAGQVPNTDPTPLVPSPEGDSAEMTTEEPADSPGPRPHMAPTHTAGLGTKKPAP